MNTIMNAKGSKKLLAALAVLAVALVALAAVPAVATESDATDESAVEVIAAGYLSDADTAKGVLGQLKSDGDFTSISTGVMFVAYKVTGTYSEVVETTTVEGSIVKGTDKFMKESAAADSDVHTFFFYIGNDVDKNGEVIGATPDLYDGQVFAPYDEKKTYTIKLEAKNGNGVVTEDTVTVKGEGVAVNGTLKLNQNLELKTEGSMTISAEQIDLNGKNLSVKGGNVTLEAASFGTEFLYNKGSEASEVSVTGKNSRIRVTNEGLGVPDDGNGNSLVMSRSHDGIQYSGIAFKAESGSTLEFCSKNSKVSTLQTGSGNTTITVDGESSKFVYDAGSAQNVGVVLKNNAAATVTTLVGTSFAGYFALNGATLTANTVNAYSVSLVKSDMIVENLAFYPCVGTNHYSDENLKILATANAAIDSNSELRVAGKIFANGFWTGSGFKMAPVTIQGAGSMEGDLAFVNDNVTSNAERINLAGFVLKGVTYTGTASYTDDKGVTSTAVFKNIKAAESGCTISAGSIHVNGELATPVNGVIEVGGDVAINGTLDAGVTLKIKEGTTVQDTSVLTVSAGASVEIASGANASFGTLTVNAASGRTAAGSVYVASGATLGASAMINNGSVVAATGSTVNAAPTGSNPIEVDRDTGDMKIAYLGGEVVGAEFGATQEVHVDKDTTVTSGTMKVFGKLIVAEGVTLTISADAELIVDNTATAEILGAVVIESDDERVGKMTVVSNAQIRVSGSLTVQGDLEIKDYASLVVEQGAVATIGSAGSIGGKVEIKDSADLNVAGRILDSTVFDVRGTLTIDSGDSVSGSFTVNLEDGAVLDIVSIVLGNSKTIAVADPGTVIYDEKDKNVAVPSNKKNELKLAASFTSVATGDAVPGAEITGLKVVSTMKSNKITTEGSNNGKYKHVYTMGISGSVAVAPAIEYGESYTGDRNETFSALAAAMTLEGATGAEISNALSLARDVALTLKGTVAVKGAVALAYVAADTSATGAVYTSKAGYGSITVANGAKVKVTAPVVATASSAEVDLVSNGLSDGGKIELSGDGSITVSKQLDSTTGVSAAYYKLVTGTGASQVVTYVYTTADSAIAKLADGSVAEATIYGTQAVNTSAQVPAKAVLTIQNGAELAIGKDDKAVDVILTIASGATFKAASGSAKVNVNGTLYAQDRTNVKSTLTITSAVVSYEMNGDKEVKQGWAKWTNLTTALAEAESGQRIVLNDKVDLAVNTVVPEGVTLDANGKRVLVECGVTLTVDGTLDLTDAGSVLVIAEAYVNDTEASKSQPAASIVLNGSILVDDGNVVKVKPTKESSGLVYTGTTSGRTITAAYYVDSDGVTHITTVASAAAAIKDAEGQKVQLKTYETEVLSFSNVSFAGNADAAEGIATVEVYGPVTAFGVTLADAKIVFVAPAADDGTASTIRASIEVAGADGSAVLKGAFSNGFTVGSTSYGDDVEAVLGISGTVADYADTTTTSDGTSEETSSIVSKAYPTEVVLDGTVYILGAADIKTDKIVVSGTVSALKPTGTTGNVVLGGALVNTSSGNTAVTISGTLNVFDGVQVNAAGAAGVTVSGKLVVGNDEGSSKFSAAVMTVSGTVDASATSETTLKYTGSVTVSSKLYVGVTSKIESSKDIADEVFTSTAAVTGNVNVTGYAVKAAGAAVPAGWTADDSAASAPGALKIDDITVFTVGETTGADEYITVLDASGNKKVADFRLATVDSEFKGWKNSKGAVTSKTGDVYSPATGAPEIGDPDWKTVEAEIDSKVFNIFIVTDGGIGRITLNGVLMTSATISGAGSSVIVGAGNYFVGSSLVAGSYTVEFAAAAGYDASKAVLTDMDGNVLNTKTILINDETTKDSDTPRTLMFQLVGSEVAASSGGSSSGGMSHDDAQGIIDAIDKNTDAVKNQPAGGSADNGLTNILLIVLVVLIVIMAALVAMRMMRS